MPRFRAAVVAAVLLLAGCGDIGPVMPASSVPAVDIAQYRLAPGDKLNIRLYNDPNFSGEYSVNTDGMVELPFVGLFPASGKTMPDFSRELRTRLADGLYNDPQLSVQAVSFRPFYILGEVNRPGEYAYSPGMTLAKAVALGGGYTYRANTRAVVVKLDGQDQEMTVEADQTIPVGPGMTIRVLERHF